MPFNDGKIGDYDVLVLAGSASVQRFKQSLVEVSRPGLDGQDYLKTGKRARMFTVRTFRDASSEANLRTLEAAFDAYQSTLQDYKDENEQTWVEVFVVSHRGVRQYLEFATGYKQAAGETWALFSVWRLQLTKLNPQQ